METRLFVEDLLDLPEKLSIRNVGRRGIAIHVIVTVVAGVSIYHFPIICGQIEGHVHVLNVEVPELCD
jgi:hypothetical protein